MRAALFRASRVLSRHIVALIVGCGLVGVSVLPAGSGGAATPAARSRWLSCFPGVAAGSPASDPSYFPLSALSGRAVSEQMRDPAVRALRRFLASNDLGFRWSRGHWLVLRRTPLQVLFGRAARKGQLDQYVTVVKRRDTWIWLNGGACAPAHVYPGHEAAPFALLARPRASARSLPITISTGTCGTASAPNAADRLQRVAVTWRPHRVLVSVLLRSPPPLPPGVACAGIGIEFTVRVLLPRTVGRRRVYDAIFVPPTQPMIFRHASPGSSIPTIQAS